MSDLRIYFRIRSIALVALALALTGYLVAPCAEAVGQSSPVKVSIDTENRQHAFDSGEQVSLVITIENTGNVEAVLSRSCDTLDNGVSLTDSSGDSPPLTAFGKKATSVFDMSCPRRALRLQSGASKKVHLDISQLYDLSQPGKYTVSISRFVRSPRGSITSSPLTFVVRQKIGATGRRARPPANR